VLDVSGEALAARREADLRLPVGLHRRRPVDREQAVQEERHLGPLQREDDRRDEAEARPLPLRAERGEPFEQRVSGARRRIGIHPQGGRNAAVRAGCTPGARRRRRRAALCRDDDERRHTPRLQRLAHLDAAERLHGLPEVAAQPLIGAGEAERRTIDLGVAQEVREQPYALLPERRSPEDGQPARRGHVIAGTQLDDRPPAADREERVRAGGPDLAPERRRDLVDGLDAVVDEGRGLGVHEVPLIVEGAQTAGAGADDVLDRPHAAVGEHDLGVGRETLPHAGAPRDDDEIRRLQTRRQAIEVGEAGGDARDRLLLLVEPLDRLEGPDQHLADAAERGTDLPFRDVEDQTLGLIEQLGDVAARLVAARGDVGGRADQIPQERAVADDAGVVTTLAAVGTRSASSAR
jgi:hypothetical protein